MAVPNGSPPASTNSLRPSGKTSRIESPCPTSIAIISNMPERICGCGGIVQIQNQLKESKSYPKSNHQAYCRNPPRQRRGESERATVRRGCRRIPEALLCSRISPRR